MRSDKTSFFEVEIKIGRSLGRFTPKGTDVVTQLERSIELLTAEPQLGPIVIFGSFGSRSKRNAIHISFSPVLCRLRSIETMFIIRHISS